MQIIGGGHGPLTDPVSRPLERFGDPVVSLFNHTKACYPLVRVQIKLTVEGIIGKLEKVKNKAKKLEFHQRLGHFNP